jgi:hypothetical protein
VAHSWHWNQEANAPGDLTARPAMASWTYFLVENSGDIHPRVNLFFTIRRFLAILAVAGLVLSPIVRPVMAISADAHASEGDPDAVDHGAATAPADMPCCPDKSQGPDCGYDCPFMALCTPLNFQTPILVSLFVPLGPGSNLIPRNESELDSLAQVPPTRPPKA